MKSFDSPINKADADRAAGQRSEADRFWQTAGDRVLLYLRCHNFPAPKALELALQALKEAERQVSLGSGKNPVVEAMNALHQLLSEQKTGLSSHSHSPTACCEWFTSPVPSLQRLHMVPEEMFFADWGFLSRRFR